MKPIITKTKSTLNGIRTLMRNSAQKCMIVVGLLLAMNNVFAQNVDVTASAGTLSASYTTLKGAFDAINAGTHTGVITLGIAVSTTETAPAVLNESGSGSASYTSIVISPSGGGARTISGAIVAGSPLIDLNGADNVTLDGLNTGGNSLTISNTTSGTTVGTSTIRLANDATGNYIQNCTILGTSTGAVGATLSTGTILIGAGTTSGNDNNQILNNNIGDGLSQPSMAISSVGTSTVISNDNMTVTGNNIYNWWLNTGANAINITNCSAWNISSNRFYQTASRTFAASAIIQKAIFINCASGTGFTINNNIIGYASSTGTGMMTYLTGGPGRFAGIEIVAGATPATEVQGNTINGLSFATTSGGATLGSAAFNGIVVTGGGVNVGNTTANIIGATTGTGSSSSNIYLQGPGGAGYYPIYVNSPNTCNISNNIIGAINITPTTGASTIFFTGITVSGAGSHLVLGNKVGNATASNISLGVVGTSTGIATTKGIESSSTGAVVIGSSGNGNTIQNISMNAVATNGFTGIIASGAGTSASIQYDTIRGIVFGATSTAHGSNFTGISCSGAFTSTVEVSNNSLGTASANLVNYNLTAAVASGTLTGIAVTGAATSTSHSIQNNDLRGIVYTNAGSGAHTYINFTSGGAANNTSTISGNTFTNLNLTTTGAITFISHSYTISSTGTLNISNNQIVTAFTKAGASGNVTCTTTGSSSVNGSVANYLNNNFSNITVAGSSTITGISNTDGSGTGTSTKTITGNTFNNWTAITGAIVGVNVSYFHTGNHSVSTNTFSNITGQGAITGMSFNASANSATALNIASNTLYNLSSTGTGGAVTGITISNTSPNININSNSIRMLKSTGVSATIVGLAVTSAGTTNVYQNTIDTLIGSGTTSPIVNGISVSGGSVVNIYRNKIHALSQTAAIATTVGAVNGILLSGGTAVTASNNIIGLLTAPAANLIDAIRGISVTSTTANTTYNLYHNTIYVDALSSGANFGTSGIFHTISTTATTSTLNLINNIVSNTSTAAGTGLTVAYRRSGGALYNLANYASTSNNNLFYAGIPSLTNLIYYDGTSSAQTMGAYKAGVFTAGSIDPRDANSFSESISWLSTTGLDANFLHIATSASQVESGGAVIGSISGDYDGDSRTGYPLSGQVNGGGLAPDLGADEFDGIPVDLIGPSISYALITDQVPGTSRVLASFATISDPNKVDSVANKPRIYYKKISDADIFGANNNVTNGWKWVETTNTGSPFSFTLDYSLLNGGVVSAGDIIQYFVVAQDLKPATPNVGAMPSAGFTGTSVSSVTAPTTPDHFLILSQLAGSYGIGGNGSGPTVGNNYVSLSEAFADLKAGAVRSIYVTNGGVGYGSAPTVVFTGGGSPTTIATATAIISGGVVTQVMITNYGAGYTSTPTISFTGGAPGTVATATANLSTGRVLSASTIFELTSTYSSGSEDGFPITINALENASASKTLTIRPHSSVVSNLTITSASTIATIDINGGSYVTIDGRPGGTGSTKRLFIENTSTSAGSTGNTILMRNEASNDTLMYLDIKSANSNLATASVASTLGSIPGALAIGTTTGANGNDNNIISYCDIHSVTAGGNLGACIYAGNGTTAGNTANNDNNTIDNCNVYDFFLAAGASAGIDIALGNNNYTVTNNHVYQTGSRAYTGTQTIYGLWINPNTALTGTLTTTGNYIITGNYIGGNAADGTGMYTTTGSVAYFFKGMDIATGLGTSTAVVQNNTLTNWTLSGAFNAANIFGIGITNGNATVTGNLIGSTSNNLSISCSTTANNGTMIGLHANGSSGGVLNYNNNTVSGITFTAGPGNVAAGFNGIAASGGADITLNNNIIGSASLANSINLVSTTATSAATNVRGIICNSVIPNFTFNITNNLVANMTYNNPSTASGMYGLAVQNGGTANGSGTIKGNTIRNLSSALKSTTASLNGLFVNPSANPAAPIIVDSNFVYSLTCSDASAAVMLTGMSSTGFASGNVVSRNKVYACNIASTNIAATLYGLRVNGGTNTVSNNEISLGVDAVGTSNPNGTIIHGISDVTGTNMYYYNTVRITGVVTGATTASTYAFNGASATAIAKNNLFVNDRSGGATGFHYAIKATTGATLDYNDYYVTGTKLGNNGGDVTTTPILTGQDANSQMIDPGFTSTTLLIPTICAISNKGVAIVGYTTDKLGTTRDLSAPDMGAYEFGPAAPTVTSPVTYCQGATATALSATGVNTLLWFTSPVGGTGALSAFTPSTAVGGTTIYYVADSNTTTGCISSRSVINVIVSTPIVGNILTDQGVCSGSIVSLSAPLPTGGDGVTYTYKWLSSTTSATAGFAAAGGSDNAQNYTPGVLTQSTWYKRIVTSGVCGSDTSVAASITVTPVILGNTLSSGQIIVSGTSPSTITGSTPTGGSGVYSYSWLVSTTSANDGFSAIPSSNTQDYASGILSQNTWYKRVVISGSCSDTSAAVAITTVPAISLNTVSGAQTICLGSATTTLTGSTPSGGTGTYTYTWLASTSSATTGFSTIASSNTQDYNPGILSQSTWYRRYTVSGPSMDTSAAILVAVNKAIATNSITGSLQTICSGSAPAEIAASVATGGDETSYTYEWLVSTSSATDGFGAVASSNTQNYTPVALSSTSWYKRVVTSGVCNSDTTVAAQVVVNQAIATNTITGSTQTICSGSVPAQITASVATGGDGSSYTYEWLASTTSSSAGFSAIASSNSQNYTPAALTNTTWFKRVVTSGVCSQDTSSAILVTVNPVLNASVILSSTSTSVCGPGSITFTAIPTNEGTTPHYQWKLNGVDVGVDSFGYTSATPSVNDSVYVVLTSNATPCLANAIVNSNGIKLTNSTVTPTVSITVPDSFICSGSTVIFTPIPSNGGASPSYEWKKNGLTVSSATNYSSSSLVEGDSITVILTSNGSCLSTPLATSNYIKVHIRQATSITAHPVSITRCVGTSASFGVTGSGDGIVNYQWRKNGVNIGGATASTYTLPSAVLTDSGSYSVIVKTTCDSLISSVGYLTMNAPIATNTTTAAQTICSGSTPSALVGSTATGGDGLTYTYSWLASTTSATAGFALATGTNNTVDYTPSALTQNTWYRRAVTSGVCESDTSVAVKVTVTTPIATNTTTAAQTICSGSIPAALVGSIATGGDGLTYTYSWLSSTTSATAGFALAAGTNTTQGYTPAALTQSTWFRRVVSSGACANDTSVAVKVTVTTPITTNTTTAAQTICSGSTPAALVGSIPTGGDGASYTYSWLTSTTSATTGFTLAAGTNTTQGYAPAALTQNTWFRRVVSSGACANDTSVAVKMTITTPIATNTTTAAQTICSGSTPAALVGSTPTGGDGATYTYSWLASTTSATIGFTLAAGTNTTQGYAPAALTQSTWFRRVVTSGACANDTSVAVKITVTIPIATNTTTAAQTICTGSIPAALVGSTATGGDGLTYTYSWLTSTSSATTGFALATGTNNTVNYTPAALTQSTWYRRVVSSGACAKDTSVAIKITVTTPIAANTTTAAQTICTGSTPAALVGSTPTGGDGSTYTYGWVSSTTSATAGFAAAAGTNTTQGYAPAALTQTTWFRRVVTSGACAKDSSVAVQIMVNTPGTWSGATSNVWSNTANWTCPLVPTSTTNVTIPTGATNMPVITDAQQAANLTIQTGASLTLNVSTSMLNVFGTITNSGTFTNSNGKVVMTGSTAQTLPAGTYAKLEIKNTAGVTLGGTTTLTDSLILTSGKVNLGANNMVLGNASYASDGSATSYVVTSGTGAMVVQNIGTTGKTGNIMAPVGNSSYNPVKLNNAGTTDNYTVKVIDSVTSTFTGTTPTGLKLTTGAVNRTWVITETVTGGSNISVTPTWFAADELSGFTRGVSYVAQHNGTTWLSTTAGVAGGTNPYSITRTGITSLSVFGIASGGTLPVELISFTGNKQKQAAQLNWITASELNNSHFVLQRSVDGKTFEEVSIVKGNGTTNNVSTYTYLDVTAGSFAKAAQTEVVYYRLVQVDFDQTTSISNIVTINMGAAVHTMTMSAAPNPFMDITSIQVSASKAEEATMRVMDIQGKLIFEKQYQLEEGNNRFVIEELIGVPSGVYFVNMTTPTETFVLRIAKTK